MTPATRLDDLPAYHRYPSNNTVCYEQDETKRDRERLMATRSAWSGLGFRVPRLMRADWPSLWLQPPLTSIAG